MANTNSSRAPRSGTAAGMRESIKKAVTEMMVLFLLRQKPMYTYEMSQELTRLTGGVYTFNTLYLAIYRLQEHGYITEAGKQEAGNRLRVYFKLTDAGQRYLDELLPTYREMIGALDSLLAQDGKLYKEE
ncbi:PadR family transcriptional regulator [uncultured Gemmiger sp.]|uniref:PadR family transcriptional regulator n=1 Tax=uncultured Gemmiger sp. TaxID=1623490 RepID=UPI0025F78F31|nr:PadR family transcriptional regulator [uncultured Gemmiger sp.]